MPAKPVATRLTTEQLAKARDGLIVKGIAPENLLTRSQVLRLSVFLAITMNPDTESLASEMSLIAMESVS